MLFMNYERNKKYFSQVNKTYPIVISAALIAVGFIMVVFLASTNGLPRGLMRMIGFPLLAAGVILATCISATRIKDSELDECAAGLDESFRNDFAHKFINTDARRYKNDQRYGKTAEDHHTEPVFFDTYYFDDPDALFKKGGDGRERSSVYSLSGLMLKPDAICIGERRVSLTDGKTVDYFKECAYTKLAPVCYSSTETSRAVYEGRTQYRHIVLTLRDGTRIADLPVLADADADMYLDEINVRISRAEEKNSVQNNFNQ